MRRTSGDDPRYRSGAVPDRARPSDARAAAAARLAGATAGPGEVRRRRAASSPGDQQYPERNPAAGRSGHPAGRQGRSSRPTDAEASPSRQSRGQSRTPSQRRGQGREGAEPRRGRPVQADGRPVRASRRRQEPAPSPRRAHAIANPSAMAAGYGAAALAAPRPEAVPHEQTRPRHLKVVEPATLSAAQRRRRARAVLIATIGMGTFIAFALVYLHVVLAQRQFRIDRLNTEVSKAQTSYQNLRLKAAQLDSPQQIVSTAEGRLGMVQPSKVLYLTPSTPASYGSTTTGQAVAGSASQPTTKSQPAGFP